jgi:hypothetical protein
MALSCRMNASLVDPRLPGGVVAGKVISYKLIADGDKGAFYGEVTIGGSAGTANAVHLLTGAPDWVDEDWVENDWQVIVGETVNPPGGPDDIAYSPPIARTVDDGIVFPLAGAGDAILAQTWGGSADEEQVLIANAIRSAVFSLPSGNPNLTQTYGFTVTTVGGSSVSESITQPNWLAVSQALETAGQVGVWLSLSLKPLTTGPFSEGYVLSVDKLPIPMTVNLEAASAATV